MKLTYEQETWELEPQCSSRLNLKRSTQVKVLVEHGKRVGDAARVDVVIGRGNERVQLPLADLPELIVILQEIHSRGLPDSNEPEETDQ